MSGWIKISREITNHWLWTSAVHLQWWLDLLLMAAWEDKKVMDDGHLFMLKRGEMVASVSFLSQRWGKSAPTVIKFLKLLEAEEMINRRIVYRQTSILTICNYERYQSLDNEDVYTQVDTLVNSLVYTSKENKEVKNNNINNNARERLLDEVDEMKKNVIWLENMFRKYKISSTEIDDLFTQFVEDCRCNAMTGHVDVTDAQRHFNFWLNKKQKRYGNNRKPTPVENIDNAQQQAIRETMEFLGETGGRDNEVPKILPF